VDQVEDEKVIEAEIVRAAILKALSILSIQFLRGIEIKR
jgi:hypothetical protein